MNGQNKTVKQINNNIYWDFYENEGNSNWGYPFSVDAHIYSKAPIAELFARYIYCNPNTLEGIYVPWSVARSGLVKVWVIVPQVY